MKARTQGFGYGWIRHEASRSAPYFAAMAKFARMRARCAIVQQWTMTHGRIQVQEGDIVTITDRARGLVNMRCRVVNVNLHGDPFRGAWQETTVEILPSSGQAPPQHGLPFFSTGTTLPPPHHIRGHDGGPEPTR